MPAAPVKRHNDPNKSKTADVLDGEGDERLLFGCFSVSLQLYLPIFCKKLE
jgi:hypothetical protein